MIPHYDNWFERQLENSEVRAVYEKELAQLLTRGKMAKRKRRSGTYYTENTDFNLQLLEDAGLSPVIIPEVNVIAVKTMPTILSTLGFRARKSDTVPLVYKNYKKLILL